MTPTIETADILRKARALIDTPEKWCQHAQGRDANGVPVESNDPSCVARCALGALTAIYGKKYNTPADGYLSAAAGKWIVVYNNTSGRKHEEILAVFDKAIQLAEQSNA